VNIPFIGTQKDLDGVFQSYQASLLDDLFYVSMDDFILRYKRAIVPVYFGDIMSKFCATLVCNAAYIEKAAFVASQLMAMKNRNFDVVICSDIQPESPPQIVPNGMRGMPILASVRRADRCDPSTSPMISSFSDAGYLIRGRPPSPVMLF
jgi:hypothetical protein